jgi:hypothetical protein
MALDQPRGPNPAWKKQAATPDAAGPGKRLWQKPSDTPAGSKRRWSKKAKLGLATFMLSAIVGLMIGVILWLSPIKPACLVLRGAPFEEDLAVPHNVYGWKGLEDLADLANAGGSNSFFSWGNSHALRLNAPPVAEYDPRQPWVPRSFRERTVVLFLAYHGGADRKGGYLVVKGPRGPERVPLEKILDDLDSPELKDKNKVLILDATQVAADWPGGLLHNDFVRKLKDKELQKRIKEIKNLVVLCASDVDQRSWVSEEWQQTIFTHYVIEGLKGAAVGNNNRVTALGLYQCVRDRVQAWVQANREDVQQPILLGREDVAEHIELVQVPEPYQERKWDPKRQFQVPSELPAAWAEWAQLRSQIPAPAVYSPQLWRRYQDLLVRYEQILRAGDPTKKAGSLRTSLTRLKDRISAARHLEHVPDALTNTLSMPSVVGLTPPSADDSFQELWADPRQEILDKRTADIKEAPVQQKLLQIALTRQLLEQATRPGAGRPDLDKAKKLLRLVDHLGGRRPAEAHYLWMLLRDLDPNPKAQPPAAELRQAVEVALLAEQTAAGRTRREEPSHPYSEVVSAWIKDAVVQADQHRRRGQDLLFGPSTTWDEAGKQLAAARKGYLQAGKDAEIVRQALDVRDQLLATLPYYAAWLANQRVGDVDEKVQVNDLLARVEDLADKLAHLLEGPPAGKDLAILKSRSEELRVNFAKIQRAYDETCQRLAKQKVDQLRFLHGIEAVLALPLVEEPSKRMALILESRRLSATFNAKFNPEGRAQNLPDEDAQALTAAARAQRQGRMAVAITGLAERWLNEPDPGQLRRLVRNVQDSARWRDEIVEAGVQVHSRYLQMQKLTDEGLDKSVKASKLDEAAAKLQGPEYLCRLLPGGLVPAAPVEPFDPVQGSRRLRLYDFFLWQAQRTLTDHWFADSLNPQATYYQPAAEAYVHDAEWLAEAGRDPERNKSRQAAALALKKDLAVAMLEASGPPTQHVTSERDFRVGWKVSAQPGVPAGVPTFWLEVEGPVKAAMAKDLQRQAVTDPLPTPRGFDLQKVTHAGQVHEAKATLKGVFRGQRIDHTTILKLLTTPEILVYKTPPPAAAGISLRLDPSFTYGAVSIVLDCSGSMNANLNGEAALKPNRKIDMAREALGKVLQKIPRDTYLSVLVFGHENPKNTKKQAELGATIRTWIRKPAKWDPGDLTLGLETLKNRVGNLEALNFSPIAEAICQAKEEGFPDKNKNFKGAKVILALTDGDDNLFDFQAFGNNQGQRTPAIRKHLMKEFKDSDIEVNVVCFAKKNSDDAKDAAAQFDVVKELDPPGRFLVEPSPAKLAITLEEAIRPRLRLDGRPGPRFPADGLVASPAGKNLEWSAVAPGFYTGRVQKVNRQDVELRPGHLLNLKLKRELGEAVFERGLLYDFVKEAKGSTAKGEWHVKRDNWHVSVAQNQFVQGNKLLRQLVAIEQERQGAGATLEQVEPRFVWLELKAPDVKKPPSFLWYNEFGYPAPTFRLEAPTWPSSGDNPAAPELSVWWSKHPHPGETRSLAHRPGPFSIDLEGQIVDLAGTQVKFTTVKPDPARAVTVSTQGDIRKTVLEVKPCLVVELDHTPGKLVCVQADERLGHRGEEHLFYPSSGKYTAIFWGVSGSATRPFQLTVISLDAFKDQAAGQGHSATLHLNVPNPVDGGPSRISKELKPLE